MKAHKMPECACPHCGHKFNAATSPTGDDRPNPGDISVCIECRKISVFNDDLTTRKPSGEELMKFARDPRITLTQVILADLPPGMKKK